LDAVALQCLDSDFGQYRLAGGLSMVTPAMPFRVGREPRLNLAELLVGIDRRPRRRVHGHYRVHEIGISDGALKRLVPAVRVARDRDEVLDAERVEERPLRRDNIADADGREIGAVGLAGSGIDACRAGRPEG